MVVQLIRTSSAWIKWTFLWGCVCPTQYIFIRSLCFSNHQCCYFSSALSKESLFHGPLSHSLSPQLKKKKGSTASSLLNSFRSYSSASEERGRTWRLTWRESGDFCVTLRTRGAHPGLSVCWGHNVSLPAPLETQIFIYFFLLLQRAWFFFFQARLVVAEHNSLNTGCLASPLFLGLSEHLSPSVNTHGVLSISLFSF